MNKLFGWILGMTKIGKAAKGVQDFLEGKKQMLASLAAAIPATLQIMMNFTSMGAPYLLHVASTPEFVAASAGWIGLFNALKIQKARYEVEALHEDLASVKKLPIVPPEHPVSPA